MHRILAHLLVAACATGQAAKWPTDGWPVSSPERQGLAPRPFAELRRAIGAGRYRNVDRVLVVRRGYLVFDERYDRDYREISRGQKRSIGFGEGAEPDPNIADGFNYLDPDTHPFYRGRAVHTLQSVTKSITSALIGIAIQRGEIEGVDAKLLSFFGGYDLSEVDARLREATLEDLLTMRTGIEWHESDRPLDGTNTTMQLEHSGDWIQFTLDQPMDAAPGEKWAYNSGGSHLMSGVIKHATDEFVDGYAKRHLFGPLGIDDFHWKKTPKGYPDTEGGLYLAADQLAKIGYLYLRDGVWEDQRILPEGWVEASTKSHVARAQGGRGYGYQWWRLDRGDVAVWAGLGFGGQFLFVIPDRDLIGVANSWNVFGQRVASVSSALLTALLDASK